MFLQNSRAYLLGFLLIFFTLISLYWFLNDYYDTNESQPKWQNHFEANLKAEKQDGKKNVQNKMPTEIDWKTVDFLKEPLPNELTETAKQVEPTVHRLQLQKYDVFYRQALPPKGVDSSNQEVLLLHGMRFKSQTWLELNTIHLLAAMGHKVTAIDLPGYGESSKGHVPESERGEFLHEIIAGLKLNQPIIVSPSLSGSFTVPLLETHPEEFGGYVPVAPIMTGKLTSEQYKKKTIPTLIVYGEKDKDLGEESVRNLGNIPTSQVRMLPAAGHPAYLDQPEMFHKLLFNFLKAIK